MQNLTLIGFMGTGKSSVGQVIARHLNFSFLDTDSTIESRAGRTISEIFARDGEAAFRDLERRVVEELASRRKTVVSTGGGLPTVPGIIESLKTHSIVVCLWASPEKIWERVRGQTHRPLLNEPDPPGKIHTLLAAREPFYRQADILVNTEMRSIREVAQQVMYQFKMARRAHGSHAQ
jgi:shikimate kinase